MADASCFLESIPRDRSTLVLLRHGERMDRDARLPPWDTPLSARGRERSTALGRGIGDALTSLRSSPVPRCVQTAEALAAGAGVDIRWEADPLLGDPGVFVCDPVSAGRSMVSLSLLELVERLHHGGRVPPGFREGPAAVQSLLRHLFRAAGGKAGLHVAVTHDYILWVTMRYFFAERPLESLRPDFLDAAALWREGRALCVRYRGRVRRCNPLMD